MTLVPLQSEIVERIKVSHHVMFFKDVVMASMSDVPLEAALELALNQCNLEIFNYCVSENLTQQLVLRCLPPSLPEVIKFVH